MAVLEECTYQKSYLIR